VLVLLLFLVHVRNISSKSLINSVVVLHSDVTSIYIRYIMYPSAFPRELLCTMKNKINIYPLHYVSLCFSKRAALHYEEQDNVDQVRELLSYFA
jgi:hypothetical protein